MLPDTLGLGPEVWRILSKCHDMRNRTEYEGALDVDDRLGSDLIGAHVTCFNPDLDPEGSHARRIVGTIHRALGSPTSL